MNLLLLVPGTGHFYCGSCLRDDALAKALCALGHDAVVVPLYLPMMLEDGAETGANDAPVHMGGINLYLQQKASVFRRLPQWLARWLDSPRLLRWASRRSSMTEAPYLGPMTLSMIRGESGRQAKELEKLIAWVASTDRPDVVLLSNVMLSGIVRRLREELGCPVVMTLQGEAPFLDSLQAPFAEQAWQELRARAPDIDAFIAVSHYYADLMRDRLALRPERVHVVHNGLDIEELRAEPRPLDERRPPAVGYLARMCKDKGLDTLVDAYLLLKEKGTVAGLRLRVAGVMLKEDRSFVADLRERLGAHIADVDFMPNVERAEKLAFLQTLSALTVPATYGESFGLYLLEAMAAGVPVVQPRHAAFPEILDATGGGVLCQPDSARSLADALEQVLLDGTHAAELAANGRRAVLERFHSERMAREFTEICSRVSRDR